MSDLWYHCLVLLAYHNINPAELLNELGGRRSKEITVNINKRNLLQSAGGFFA